MSETLEFSDVVTNAIATYRSKDDVGESSVETFKSHMRKFVRWYDTNGETDSVAEASATEIRDYINDLNEAHPETTVANHFATLNSFFGLLVTDFMDVREDDPMEDIRELQSHSNPTTMKQKETREKILHIEPPEKELLCENVPAPKVRNELLIRMLWQTGMREHEIRNLRIQDVDRPNRTVKIYSKKTDEPRTVPYQRSVEILLDQWLDGGYRDRFYSSKDSEYVFVSKKQEQLSPARVNDVVIKAAEEAGIQEIIGEDAGGRTRRKITTHTLRHSYGIQAVKNGINLRYLQTLMGHADISTTETYLEAVEDDAVQKAKEKGPGTEDLEDYQ